MSEDLPSKIETVLVCYTQATFDQFEERPGESQDEGDEQADAQEANRCRYLAKLAERLTAALQATGRTAEIVKLPQRSFSPRDISKAAFAWRILDLKESNGRPIDLALCLDFPSWSLQHPRKWVWLTAMPNFILRSRSGPPQSNFGPPQVEPEVNPNPKLIRLQRTDREAENAQAVAALLLAERRGLAEARRLLVGTRPVAEELARRGLQAEFHPLPPNLDIPPADPQWQTSLNRIFPRSGTGDSRF